MTSNESIRRGRHVVSELYAHLVFVTKYRHAVFSGEHLERMESIIREVCEDFGVTLSEFNGESNHVHLLVEYPPKAELSRLINSLKGVTSRLLRKEFPALATHYWRAKVLWSPSYYAGSAGGASLESVRRYIEGQSRPA
ncbi:IS200/IS605 family transposase [uncultured Microbacterium sp.]|uniref:IS200/IS605 family transposase n=1 Tax=uncultured Microbacterium sp. TaxID=191216 RepID=UPI00261C9754|nr:IS200/IS605 family transposase [uncultured Microbacterium sp.]